MKHLPARAVLFGGRSSFLLLAIGIAAGLSVVPSCTGGAEQCRNCAVSSDGGAFGGRGGSGGNATGGTAPVGGSGLGGAGIGAASGGNGGTAGTSGAGTGGGGGSGQDGAVGGTGGAGGTTSGQGGRGGGAGASGGTGGGAGMGGRGGAGSGGAGGNAGASGSGGGGMGGANLPAAVAYYPFEGNLNDTSGNAKNGSAKGTVGYGAGQVGQDLNVNNTPTTATNYVALPANLLQNARTMTIAFWVRVRTDRAFARVFDFGTDNQTYMYFTPHETPSGFPRFGITTSSNTGEQLLVHTGAMKVATWYHVAITLGPNGGVLYVDGTQSVVNTAISLRPISLGTMPNDWLGHSEWTNDPYFDGEIDELRIYTEVLTADQVHALYLLR